jgi:LIVCS family branched-chain amino acid:cation transporter
MSIEARLKARSEFGSILASGLALFSMFFGAGNLVFPLIIGRASGTETTSALAGLALSAVAFPLLGLLAMMLYNGNLKLFLERLGRWPAAAMLFVLYMSQGPFGSMPRLVTLMHASAKMYVPGITLSLSSVIICALVFLLSFRPQRLIQILGVVLTPLFLVTLGALVIVGVYHAPEASLASEGAIHHFKEGVKGGYQTLDLTAALLFATVIMPHIAKGVSTRKELFRKMTGVSLLMACYIGLCWISAHYSWTLDAATAPEELLHVIAVKILGNAGGLIADCTVLLACLTTAISLSAVFSQYLHEELFQKKVGLTSSLAITLAITAAMANLGFSGIMNIMGPVLEILYPSLIILCLFNIGHSLYQVKPIRTPVFATLGLGVLGFVFG